MNEEEKETKPQAKTMSDMAREQFLLFNNRRCRVTFEICEKGIPRLINAHRVIDPIDDDEFA